MHFFIALSAAASILVGKPMQAQFLGEVSGKAVQISIDAGPVRNEFAGKLKYADATHVWSSVCAQVRNPVGAGQVIWMRPVNGLMLEQSLSRAAGIVAAHFREAQSPEQCAALQLAVWEAVEDGGDHADFQHGALQAWADPVTIGWAQQYYDTPGSPSGAVYLQTAASQNQISIS